MNGYNHINVHKHKCSVNTWVELNFSENSIYMWKKYFPLGGGVRRKLRKYSFQPCAPRKIMLVTTEEGSNEENIHFFLLLYNYVISSVV